MAEIAVQEHVPPWCGYMAWRDGDAVGFATFKGAPTSDGEVEIAYLTFPACEGTGVATHAAEILIEIARNQGVQQAIAHTLPHVNASTSVLRKIGFVRDGEADDPEEGLVWRWKLGLLG